MYVLHSLCLPPRLETVKVRVNGKGFPIIASAN